MTNNWIWHALAAATFMAPDVRASGEELSLLNRSWVDVNGDGALDVTVLGQDGQLRVLLQGVHAYADATAALGLPDDLRTRTYSWPDFDGDGMKDLFVLEKNGGCRLWLNDGRKLVDWSVAVGLDTCPVATSAQWLDYNGDGTQDLALVSLDGLRLWSNMGGRLQPKELEFDATWRPASNSFEANEARSFGTESSPDSNQPLSQELMATRPSSGTPAIRGTPRQRLESSVGGGGNSTTNLGCVNSIRDSAVPGNCLSASSVPMLGALYPIGEELFIDASTGFVGMGTLAPSEALTVAGTIESRVGGFRFPDGTLQSTAQIQGPMGPLGPPGPPGPLVPPAPSQVLGTVDFEDGECSQPAPIYSFSIDPLESEVRFQRDFDACSVSIFRMSASMELVDEMDFDFGDGFTIRCKNVVLEDVSIETLEASVPRLEIVLNVARLEWELHSPSGHSTGSWDFAANLGSASPAIGPATDLHYAWFRDDPGGVLPQGLELVTEVEQVKTGSGTGHTGGGGGGGHPSFELAVRLPFAERSLALMVAMKQGVVLNSARIDVVNGDETMASLPELTYQLVGVGIDSMLIDLDLETGRLMSEVQLSFDRIEWIYHLGQSDESSTAWDLY